jgi:hypothetical protein
MIQISSEMARYLFNSNHEIYKLYPNGTESLIEDMNEIINVENDIIFGVEK